MDMEAGKATTHERIFETVRAELLRVARQRQPQFAAEIGLGSSLIVDLGLDSLSLVEAVVAIEEALRIEALPLDALHECKAGCEREAFTVGALVKLCMERVAGVVEVSA